MCNELEYPSFSRILSIPARRVGFDGQSPATVTVGMGSDQSLKSWDPNIRSNLAPEIFQYDRVAGVGHRPSASQVFHPS